MTALGINISITLNYYMEAKVTYSMLLLFLTLFSHAFGACLLVGSVNSSLDEIILQCIRCDSQ